MGKRSKERAVFVPVSRRPLAGKSQLCGTRKARSQIAEQARGTRDAFGFLAQQHTCASHDGLSHTFITTCIIPDWLPASSLNVLATRFDHVSAPEARRAVL